MLLNNRFSNKNTFLYKMKCLNTRNNEYYSFKEEMYDKIEKFNDKK